MDKEVIIKMREAIKNNDLEYISNAIDEDANLITAITFWGTWLHDAATYGMIDVAKLLIEKGADVNQKGGASNAGAVTEAAFFGFKNIVELLYTNGAIWDVSTFSANPLFAAISKGHIDIAEYLIANGIDLNASYDVGSLHNVDAYEYAREYGQTEIAELIKNNKNK